MELVGRADPRLDTRSPTCSTPADVVVDFSEPDAALANARACLEAGVHCVMGTTGADFSELEGVGSANLFVAPNFADRRGADDGGRQARRPPTCRTARSSRCTTTTSSTRPPAPPSEPPTSSRGRRERARADPLGPAPRPGGPPGSRVRRPGPDAHDQARLDSHASRSCRACCWRCARSVRSSVPRPWGLSSFFRSFRAFSAQVFVHEDRYRRRFGSPGTPLPVRSLPSATRPWRRLSDARWTTFGGASLARSLLPRRVIRPASSRFERRGPRR